MSEQLPKRERVPDYHYSCEQSRALIETLQDASLEAKAALEDVVNQFFVATATWGLALWEGQVGIETDETLTLTTRRSAVLSKLQASGNTTAEMVRSLAEAITGYEARVILNAQDYSFTLEFLGDRAELAAIDVSEVRAVVEQIKPAHLQFVISGLIWSDLETLGFTWAQMEAQVGSWADFESKFFIHQKEN